MSARVYRGASLLALAIFAAGLGACTVPRPGPTMNEIFSGSVLRDGDAYIVAVGDRVNRAANVTPALGFSDDLRRARLMGGDTIRVGDEIAVTVFENVPEGLLTTTETAGTTLDQIQVDEQGYIYVPFAGRIRAAGQTPEGLRATIARRLDEQTPDPQLYVSRTGGDGAAVSLVGRLNAQGVYPIERPTRSLTAMIARAGGVTIPPQVAQVTLTRGSITDRVWLEDLFRHPELDIALRGGDRVLVQEDTRNFSVLGATGVQNQIPFDTPTISAVEALARVGGLDPTRADPTGVFVFRNEPEAIARSVLGMPNLIGDQRVVYVLDLTAPNGMFLARDFKIRDGDTVYVTEAAAVQWNRLISTLTGTLSATGTAASLVDGG